LTYDILAQNMKWKYSRQDDFNPDCHQHKRPANPRINSATAKTASPAVTGYKNYSDKAMEASFRRDSSKSGSGPKT